MYLMRNDWSKIKYSQAHGSPLIKGFLQQDLQN